MLKLKNAAETVSQPLPKPVVEPSIPIPNADPLRDVRDVMNLIRRDSAQAPGEYLDEIRSVLGAE